MNHDLKQHADNLVALPTPEQLAWQDLELGMFCHFGINTFCNQEWGKARMLRLCLIRTDWMPNSGSDPRRKPDSVISY